MFVLFKDQRVVKKKTKKKRECCMSVNCKEIDAGGIGELVNPLQWPQLRKKRRLLLLVVTPALPLLPFPFVVMLG